MTFIEYYKLQGKGWLTVDELPAIVQTDLWIRLRDNDKRIGCFVYDSHLGNPLRFQGMKIGYYVRSKNPFSWRFHSTWGGNR